MWECGLKLCYETGLLNASMSLLMWECGLKRKSNETVRLLSESLLMWECGLKHTRHTKKLVQGVTPYVGVWIETLSLRR